MTAITITVPENLDRKIAVLKAERGIRSKAVMIVEIIDEYFKNVSRLPDKIMLAGNDEKIVIKK